MNDTSDNFYFFKLFKAINENIMDCAKSLRRIADGVEDQNKRNIDKNSWTYVCDDGSGVPGPEYNWVLVRIRDLHTREIYDVPHIAAYCGDGKWISQEWDEPYGSDAVPFEVVFWRQIPGDR